MQNQLASIAMLVAAAAVGNAQAQTWPDKPIKLLAPSTPGGPPDAYARALGDLLAKELGQPVVIENLPAVGGMIAAQNILRAPADGYTLLVNTAGMMTITPNANAKAQYKAADFANICQGVEAGLVLATHPSVGATSFADLSRWVKAQKTPPTYSSYSPGSPAHFLGYQYGEALKVDMTHVPYKSSPQQITDMIGGVAPLGFVQIATASPHIQAGKLVAHATTGSQRSAQLPDVPTVAEVGMPQLETTVWFGLSAPKGVSPAIVKRLTDAHQTIAASPDFKARMATSGLAPTPGVCGDVFLKKMNEETVRWARIVKATGFVAD
ncbi:tripartite tricarboxylate transporter substrate binding protein [Hydrogenophaga sp.]|uniref:tripartite tricarboxylate transporter substrate binding protein n=1 Tax=Hydrogenophaga sp. TaxID=1904254 RepID=UPI0027282A0A|nr:tripartite tricarboxylate transporter substrate binding protein [Hydrogenophaga sp.]MDO9435545.1 tripartite tricarboxylate transporter substrate binding protein [Hydrogenophaga sp.]